MSGVDGLGYEQPGWRGRAGARGPVPPVLLASPRRRTSAAFTILLTLAMVVGAAAIGLVLLFVGAPGALVVGAVLAAIPVGPVVAGYLWLDRYEPEPPVFLGFAFGWGALVATTAALLLQAVDARVLSASASWSGTVVAPVTEEAAKGLFVLLLLWSRRNQIDGILDGLVYAGLVGAGFAFTENIMYLAAAYVGGHGTGPGGLDAATSLFVVRGIFSPFAHPLFTSAIGVGVGVAVVTRSRFWRVAAPVAGYVVAVTAHSLWNTSAFLGGGQAFVATYLVLMVPAFLLLVGIAVWAREREGRMLTRSLTDCAARGYLAPAEVPWLVRLPARRVARREARAAGGPLAERATRAYQQQAVELGFLHDRYLRGSAPSDFAQRGAEMVRRLRALRPYAWFPQPTGPLLAASRGHR